MCLAEIDRFIRYVTYGMWDIPYVRNDNISSKVISLSLKSYVAFSFDASILHESEKRTFLHFSDFAKYLIWYALIVLQFFVELIRFFILKYISE